MTGRLKNFILELLATKLPQGISNESFQMTEQVKITDPNTI